MVHRGIDFGQMSFDVEELIARLAVNADWGKLLVAHIYLDHILTQMLIDHLPRAGVYLESAHRGFAEKLALCQAHQLLDDEFSLTLKAINSYRNKFAHQLIFEVSAEQKTRLFRIFTQERPENEVLEADNFSNFLLTVVILAESERIANKQLSSLRREERLLRDEAFAFMVKSFQDRD